MTKPTREEVERWRNWWRNGVEAPGRAYARDAATVCDAYLALLDENERLKKAICPELYEDELNTDELVSLAEDGRHALNTNPELVRDNERVAREVIAVKQKDLQHGRAYGCEVRLEKALAKLDGGSHE